MKFIVIILNVYDGRNYVGVMWYVCVSAIILQEVLTVFFFFGILQFKNGGIKAVRNHNLFVNL